MVTTPREGCRLDHLPSLKHENNPIHSCLLSLRDPGLSVVEQFAFRGVAQSRVENPSLFLIGGVAGSRFSLEPPM